LVKVGEALLRPLAQAVRTLSLRTVRCDRLAPVTTNPAAAVALIKNLQGGS
jgi:hypothetical protein